MRDKTVKFIIPAIFCIAFIIVFLTCHMEVFAKSDSFSAGLDVYESSFKAAMSETLKNAGIKNAGITISKLMTDDSGIKYKVEIYIPSYIEINRSEEALLTKKLSALDLGVDNATVSITFFRERG